MSLQEEARIKMTKCKGCRICNGEACRGMTPGPGGKGSGEGFVANYKEWRKYGLVYDCIHEDYEIDTSLHMLGMDVAAPIFVAPIASIRQHYGCEKDEYSYTNDILHGMQALNMVPFFGDGASFELFDAPLCALEKNNGYGIMTVKPWGDQVLQDKIDRIKRAKPMCVAMDVDASGLVHLKNTNTPITFKSLNELKEIRKQFNCPFIIKGILSVEGAKKAIEAGADAIVISNHGGRVLDDTISGASVLEEISHAVKNQIRIFVDGGIRSGADVFKAIALGADAVLIGRPFVVAAIANGEEGVKSYALQIQNELKEAMRMCNCATLNDINRTKLKNFQ